jgi:hypothetical protein
MRLKVSNNISVSPSRTNSFIHPVELQFQYSSRSLCELLGKHRPMSPSQPVTDSSGRDGGTLFSSTADTERLTRLSDRLCAAKPWFLLYKAIKFSVPHSGRLWDPSYLVGALTLKLLDRKTDDRCLRMLGHCDEHRRQITFKIKLSPLAPSLTLYIYKVRSFLTAVKMFNNEEASRPHIVT